MSGRYFLDTNIFLYSLDRKSPAKARKAQALIRDALTTRNGVVSYQVVQEFLNAALRRFDDVMRPDEAQQYLSSVLRPLLAVHSSPALFAEALQITQRLKFSWYDSLIVAAALEAECEVLYSEDLQHGQKISGLTVRNPFS